MSDMECRTGACIRPIWHAPRRSRGVFVFSGHELSVLCMCAPEDRRLGWRSRRCRSGAKRPTLDLVKEKFKRLPVTGMSY